MDSLTKVPPSVGPGGSEFRRFRKQLKLSKSPHWIKSYSPLKGNRVSLSDLPIESLFVAGDLVWLDANIFTKTLILPQGLGEGFS